MFNFLIMYYNCRVFSRNSEWKQEHSRCSGEDYYRLLHANFRWCDFCKSSQSFLSPQQDSPYLLRTWVADSSHRFNGFCGWSNNRLGDDVQRVSASTTDRINVRFYRYSLIVGWKRTLPRFTEVASMLWPHVTYRLFRSRDCWSGKIGTIGQDRGAVPPTQLANAVLR